MRISDWSSDVCSSDLLAAGLVVIVVLVVQPFRQHLAGGRQHAAVAERGERRAGVEQAGGLQFLHARQGVERFQAEDRKSVVSGKSVSVRVDLGGRRIIKKKK